MNEKHIAFLCKSLMSIKSAFINIPDISAINSAIINKLPNTIYQMETYHISPIFSYLARNHLYALAYSSSNAMLEKFLLLTEANNSYVYPNVFLFDFLE